MSLAFVFITFPATTSIYTLSLHDALPIYPADLAVPRQQLGELCVHEREVAAPVAMVGAAQLAELDRKSTRLNSSHLGSSYAVFCLKKKKNFHNIKSRRAGDLDRAHDLSFN